MQKLLSREGVKILSIKKLEIYLSEAVHESFSHPAFLQKFRLQPVL